LPSDWRIVDDAVYSQRPALVTIEVSLVARDHSVPLHPSAMIQLPASGALCFSASHRSENVHEARSATEEFDGLAIRSTEAFASPEMVWERDPSFDIFDPAF
jgi:hypothetical protein